MAADQNWTATDATCGPPIPTNSTNATAACFSATASGGNPINWTVNLSYATSGRHGSISDGPRQFSTAADGTPQNEVYQSEGGAVVATASTTAIDGSTVQASVVFYIEGPSTASGGIPNSNITTQLEALYTASNSYPKDGTATSNLMTGIGMRESTYTQFRTPAECNADLFGLDVIYGILAKWPYESETSDANHNCVSDRGAHIGLMQIATAANQITDPNAWKWADPSPTAAANTNDAVNLFSGTQSPNEIQLATTYESDIINGVPSKKNPIPGHVGLGSLNGLQHENMALVLYSGDVNLQNQLSTILTQQYYFPQCSGTVNTNRQGNLTCSTGWGWAINTVNQSAGVNYVSNSNKTGVRDQLR